MVKKDISPEERLLDLIKGKNKKSKDAAVAQAPGKTPSESVVSKADERISGMLKGELFKNKLFEPSTLKNVNRYLVVVLIILIFYFIIDLIVVRPYKNVQTLISKSTVESGEKALPSEMKDTAIVKDYSSYSSTVPGKTIFGQSQGGLNTSEDAAASGNISDNIGLVGIIAGDNPQAIIEDKKAQKTYYLNKGQSFSGYVVEEIAEDKVILNYEGKKISLFL
jgi:hypothetical protein